MRTAQSFETRTTWWINFELDCLGYSLHLQSIRYHHNKQPIPYSTQFIQHRVLAYVYPEGLKYKVVAEQMHNFLGTLKIIYFQNVWKYCNRSEYACVHIRFILIFVLYNCKEYLYKNHLFKKSFLCLKNVKKCDV